MQSFAHFLDKWNIDSNGYKILEMHRETSNQRQIYLGVLVPVVIFALAYFVARKGARAKDSDREESSHLAKSGCACCRETAWRLENGTADGCQSL